MSRYEPRVTFENWAGRSATTGFQRAEGATSRGVPFGGGSPSRTIWYAANGTGRDSYIAVNNGGFFVASEPVKAAELGKFELDSRHLLRVEARHQKHEARHPRQKYILPLGRHWPRFVHHVGLTALTPQIFKWRHAPSWSGRLIL